MSDKMDTYTILQLVLMDDTGDSCYRMRWPGKDLAGQMPSWRIINLDAQAEERFVWGEQADLLVIYQSNDLDLLPLIERRRASGKKTLVEYNDNFYQPPPASPAAKPWTSPLIHQSYEQFIRIADGLIVTGPGLLELFSQRFAQAIHVLENHLPEEPQPFEANWSEPVGELCLGWAGSLGHMADLLAVTPTLHALLEKIPELKLCIMGNEAIPDLLHVPQNRFSYTPWGTMSQYFDFWKPLHIGIAPLLETPYNRSRSDIKAVEISSCAVLPIVQQFLPYEKFLAETGIRPFTSFTELAAMVEHYAADHQALREDARRCHRYVKEKRVGARRFERLELYRRMLGNSLPTDFAWPFPAGYHETLGTKQEVTSSTHKLKSVQSLLGQNKRDQALKAVDQAVADNPYNPDLLLAKLKLYISASNPAIMRMIDQAQEKFPADLRFSFLKLRLAPDAASLVTGWTTVIEFLQACLPESRQVYAAEAVRIFSEQVRRCTNLYPAAGALLDLFPDSALLRFTLAELYEWQGNYAEALVHYEWLHQAQRIYAENKDFLATLQDNYCPVLIEALQARTAKNTNSI
jgi:tetratricopeptide (TPR) repeat protein